MTARSPLLMILLLAPAVLAGGCQHATSTQRSRATAQQRVQHLESSFQKFISVRFDDDNRRLRSVQGAYEVERKKLERLRMRYLDVVRDARDERVQLLAMMRVAEMHLDLAARVRRIPYPSTSSDKGAFDDQLSRWALPLEAVGMGILHQMAPTSAVATRPSSSTPKRTLHALPTARDLRQRATLYLAMHEERRPLTTGERNDVRAIAAQRSRFAPPSRLVGVGRLGQRSARLTTTSTR